MAKPEEHAWLGWAGWGYAAVAEPAAASASASDLAEVKFDGNVTKKVGQMSTAISYYFTQYNSGLSKLETRIVAAKLAEDESSMGLNILLKVFEVFIDLGFPEVKIAAMLTKLGQNAKSAEKVVEAMKTITMAAADVASDAAKDAAKSDSEMTYADFINQCRDSGSAKMKLMDDALRDSSDSLDAGFKELAEKGGGKAAQDMFDFFAATSDLFYNKLMSVSANSFEEMFSLEFASTKQGKAGQVTFKDPYSGKEIVAEKGIDSGTLVFWLYLVRKPGTKYDWLAVKPGEFTSAHWKYISTGNKKEIQGIADALQESAGGKPWNIKRPKEVRLYLFEDPDNIMNIATRNADHSGKLNFNESSSLTGPPKEVKGDSALLLAAWSDSRNNTYAVNNNKKIVADTDT